MGWRRIECGVGEGRVWREWGRVWGVGGRVLGGGGWGRVWGGGIGGGCRVGVECRVGEGRV